MKKFTFVLSVLIAMTITTNAQIPNSGFETWENYNDTIHVYQKPDLWVGSLPNSPYTNSFSIQKNLESFPAGTGLYSMKIQADVASGVHGIAWSKDITGGGGWPPPPTFSINTRPDSLFLFYKCFPFGGDTMLASIFLYKNGAVIGNPVFGTTQTISNWTALAIPMTYYTTDIPDSATIMFLTGAYVQHSQSTLYVDNLSFTGFVASVSEKISENTIFNLYPNPASKIVTLNIENTNNSNLTINIYNSIGALVKSEKLTQNQQQINVEDLGNGIYMVEIKSKEWTEKQKLIIER